VRTKMGGVSPRRTLLRVIRRQRSQGALGADNEAPPVLWGHIGAYEAVTRQGVLFLLSQEPAHPSRRVKTSTGS